jgi:hypothetical protein
MEQETTPKWTANDTKWNTETTLRWNRARTPWVTTSDATANVTK